MTPIPDPTTKIRKIGKLAMLSNLFRRKPDTNNPPSKFKQFFQKTNSPITIIPTTINDETDIAPTKGLLEDTKTIDTDTEDTNSDYDYSIPSRRSSVNAFVEEIDAFITQRSSSVESVGDNNERVVLHSVVFPKIIENPVYNNNNNLSITIAEHERELESEQLELELDQLSKSSSVVSNDDLPMNLIDSNSDVTAHEPLLRNCSPGSETDCTEHDEEEDVVDEEEDEIIDVALAENNVETETNDEEEEEVEPTVEDNPEIRVLQKTPSPPRISTSSDMWVPAYLHPELHPKEFKKWIAQNSARSPERDHFLVGTHEQDENVENEGLLGFQGKSSHSSLLKRSKSFTERTVLITPENMDQVLLSRSLTSARKPRSSLSASSSPNHGPARAKTIVGVFPRSTESSLTSTTSTSPSRTTARQLRRKGGVYRRRTSHFAGRNGNNNSEDDKDSDNVIISPSEMVSNSEESVVSPSEESVDVSGSEDVVSPYEESNEDGVVMVQDLFEDVVKESDEEVVVVVVGATEKDRDLITFSESDSEDTHEFYSPSDSSAATSTAPSISPSPSPTPSPEPETEEQSKSPIALSPRDSMEDRRPEISGILDIVDIMKSLTKESEKQDAAAEDVIISQRGDSLTVADEPELESSESVAKDPSSAYLTPSPSLETMSDGVVNDSVDGKLNMAASGSKWKEWFSGKNSTEKKDKKEKKSKKEKKEKKEKRNSKKGVEDEENAEATTATTTITPTATAAESDEGSLFKRFSESLSKKASSTSLSTEAAPAPSSPEKKPTSPKHNFNFTRYPIQVERSIYRLSHTKLGNHRRPLLQQVLISNHMIYYLTLVAKSGEFGSMSMGEVLGVMENVKKRNSRRRAREMGIPTPKESTKSSSSSSSSTTVATSATASSSSPAAELGKRAPGKRKKDKEKSMPAHGGKPRPGRSSPTPSLTPTDASDDQQSIDADNIENKSPVIVVTSAVDNVHAMEEVHEGAVARKGAKTVGGRTYEVGELRRRPPGAPAVPMIMPSAPGFLPANSPNLMKKREIPRQPLLSFGDANMKMANPAPMPPRSPSPTKIAAAASSPTSASSPKLSPTMSPKTPPLKLSPVLTAASALPRSASSPPPPMILPPSLDVFSQRPVTPPTDTARKHNLEHLMVIRGAMDPTKLSPPRQRDRSRSPSPSRRSPPPPSTSPTSSIGHSRPRSLHIFPITKSPTTSPSSSSMDDDDDDVPLGVLKEQEKRRSLSLDSGFF